MGPRGCETPDGEHCRYYLNALTGEPVAIGDPALSLVDLRSGALVGTTDAALIDGGDGESGPRGTTYTERERKPAPLKRLIILN